MKKTLLSLLISTLLSSYAFAGVDCADCGNNLGDVASLSKPTKLDDIVRGIASKIDIDEDLMDELCGFTDNHDYEGIMQALKRNKLKLEDVYMDVDCDTVDYPGPTLMHLVLKTGARTLDIGEDLLITLERAKQANPKLITSIFFNMKVKFMGVGRTILDILNFQRDASRNPDTGKLPEIVAKRYKKVERRLVKLGAKTSDELDAETQMAKLSK